MSLNVQNKQSQKLINDELNRFHYNNNMKHFDMNPKVKKLCIYRIS